MSLSEVQIDASALVGNVRSLRGLMSAGTELFCVVKGNAYGHGLAEVIQVLDSEVDGFQVDDIEELRLVRMHTHKRVLVLGYVAKADLPEALLLGGELALYDVQRLQPLSDAAKVHGRPARIHLKIDALLGRQGVLPSEVSSIVKEISSYPNLQLVAAYAHFANIEDTTDLGHAFEQIEVFESALEMIRTSGHPNIGRHVSATSGLMTVEEGNDLVRVGLGVYGMAPSAALARRHWESQLRPAMRWVSHLAQVKVLPARHPVGYGLTFITPREMRIGIVPQGYSDGFDRGLSNSGEVLVRGQRCSVLGRVAMNMFAIDLSGIPDAEPEDEALATCLSGDRQDRRLNPRTGDSCPGGPANGFHGERADHVRVRERRAAREGVRVRADGRQRGRVPG
jgi:alanine racemase